MSTSSFQSGLPARFAKRSQTALTTAAVARWMTPFSGPIQRSWLSPTRSPPERAQVGVESPRPIGPTTSGASASTRGDDDLGAAPDRERQAVALEPVAGVGPERSTYAAE